MDQNNGEVGKVRLFVGGLTSEVCASDLKERFSPLGNVLSVAIPSAKYGSHRGFAYVDFLPTSEASLKKLKSSYNGCKWRGGILRIEEAKENYVDKLQKEWTAEAEALTLAAAEAERLRKISEAPALAAPKQAKSWPLLLLEKPEKPDNWKKKRDFEQGADVDGLKLFFPTLKKLKTVPSRGLGKHKRSFQRVESLPVHELSTCDCDESLRTGSCDCFSTQPAAGDARDDLVSNGEYDPISLSIAKERQKQLDLLSKMFPSDSPRKSKPVKELTTSLPSNEVASKKGLARVDEDETRDLQTDDPEPFPSLLRKGEDSATLMVPVLEKESLPRSASEVVEKKSSESEKVSLSPRGEQESTEIEADEPEMWVSFMDAAPLPGKTEENVSEFDLDELELMLSEEEEENEEEEEALEAVPKAPKKKAKRKKKKGKKAKQVTQTAPGNELNSLVAKGDGLETHSKSREASLYSTEDEVEAAIPESEELLLSRREDVTRAEEATSLVQADESKKHEGEVLPSGRVDESLGQRQDESKMSVSDIRNESPTHETQSSDDEREDAPSAVVDRDEFFAGISSSDESLDSDADEQEMWVSGINEADSLPALEGPVNALSEHPHSDLQGNDEETQELSETATSDESMEFEADEGIDEEEESSESAASDESMESGAKAEDPEIWVSGLGARGNGEEAKDLVSGDEEEKPELWVSGLENSTGMPQVTKKGSRSKGIPKSSVSASKAEKDSAALGSTSLTNDGELDGELSRVVPMEKTQAVKRKDETPVEPANVVPASSGRKEEGEKGSQEAEASAPKRNELTRAAWKSLVGETGRVVFSLKQLTGGVFPPVTPETDESPPAEDTPLEEKSSVSDTAQKKDGTSNSLAVNQVDKKNQGSINTSKNRLESTKLVSEAAAPPHIPVLTDGNVCPFMKSPDAEKEWLAKKADLRTDYRLKHKQAVKKSRKLRGR